MSAPSLLLPASVLSDIGRQRSGSVNEDAGLALPLPQGGLYAVADGMGGHAAGELASTLALNALSSAYTTGRKKPPERLARAVQQANLHVLRHAVGEYAGMGTTLVALAIDHGMALLAHVGDSRAYLLRQQQLYRLTEDQSWVAEQVRLGHLSEEDARDHQWRNVVSNALGGEEQVRLELYGFPLQMGDRLLLCSDGLSGVVEESDLLEMLTWNIPPEQLTRQLIDAANSLGGPDNITAVVVDVTQLPTPARYALPTRRKDGPVYLDVWLSQQRDHFALNYLSLGVVYLGLMGLLLFPMYRLFILLMALFLLGSLWFLLERSNKTRLSQALPPPLQLGQSLARKKQAGSTLRQLS